MKDHCCAECGALNLYCYSLRRGETICLDCFVAEIELKSILIEEMKDIEDREAPLGYMSLTEKYNIDKLWKSNLSLYGWDI